MNTITRSELKNLIDQKQPLALLEALPERYYRDAHLPGALLFPHDQTRELAPRLVPDLHTPIVVYCASETCRNSHQAAAMLRNLGYDDVRVYAEGKADWIAAGYEVAAGQN